MPASRVIMNHGRRVAVTGQAGDAVEPASVLSRLPLLVTGDEVVCERLDGGQLRVTELLPRRSLLVRPDRRGEPRPLAANLTHLMIVGACRPGFDTLLTDQFCVAAEVAGIDAMIVVNKADILTEVARCEVDDWLSIYAEIGYPTAVIDTRNDAGMAPLLDQLPGRTVVLVGASGVGKSSIIGKLLPDRDVRVGAVSAATGLGAHTTSVTCWYALEGGGALIDSPGVRQFPVTHLQAVDLRAGYRDISKAAARCRFGNCTHLVEPGCAVREALADGGIARWRYANYRKLAAAG